MEPLEMAVRLATKLVNKVESGRARSKETYKDCKDFLDAVEQREKSSAALNCYVWLAGWYATKLHATSKGATSGEVRGLCGAWVYKTPKTNWARKRIEKGISRCKHCERIAKT